jgi:hypothetical protein
MQVQRTEKGWQFNGDTLLPFGFNPQKDIDPIALHYLEELYDNTVDAELLTFHQTGTVIYTPTHQVPVAKRGVYLLRVRHPESDYEGVQFVRIMWLDELYKGTRREPYVRIEHTVDLRIAYGEDVDREVTIVKETFENTIKFI